jgi:hypothetical protein
MDDQLSDGQVVRLPGSAPNPCLMSVTPHDDHCWAVRNVTKADDRPDLFVAIVCTI